MKKVLSIDWDFFQNVSTDVLRSCYPDGVDLPTAITEITWSNHYVTDGERLNKINVLKDEYEKLLKLLLNQSSDCSVMIANSHVHAFDFIKEHLENEKAALTNIDMHHDFVNDNSKLDCGNWIGTLIKENKICENGLLWIHNPVSFEMYGIDSEGEDKDFTKAIKKINGGDTLDLIKDEKYDLIFLARSDTWSPPHLDGKFCLLVDLMKEHFTNIKMENGIDKPRLAYIRYANVFRSQRDNLITKEREPA